MCELLGFDPLHIANEGKVLIVADQAQGDHILEIMKRNILGNKALSLAG